MSVKVDRKRKIPITTLLRAIDEEEGVPEAQLGTNERILAKFADIDTNPDHQYIATTLEKEASTNKTEALLDFYRRLRPGDPPTLENARGLLKSLFFNARRYDLGRVGRYKLEPPARTRRPTRRSASCSRATSRRSSARRSSSTTASATRTTSTTWATAACAPSAS